jgi:hypothetical protein
MDSQAMVAFLRTKTLEELKNEAFAELERRGYEVRGKTPAQIRQILRRRPAKTKPIASKPFDGLQSRESDQL